MMRKSLFFFYFLLSMVFPLVFIIVWFMKNNVLPTGDAANYFGTACSIEKVFHHQGYLSGVFGLFLLRGWRPIIFPVLIVPYLIFFHGNLMYAYIAVALTVFVLSAIYTYKYFRLWLNCFPSIIATNIILLLPHIQTMMVNSYSESLLYPLMIASIYYMVKSENFSRKYYSAMSCCFFSLSILTRPVEQVFHLLPILAYYSILFCRENKNNYWKMLFVVIMLIFLSFVFLVNAEVFNRISFFSIKESGFILSIFFFMTLWMHTRKKNTNLKFRYFIPSIFCSMLVGVLWYLPFAKETYSWIYETSFGSVAQGTDSTFYGHFLMKISMHLFADGRLIVGSIGLLALISYALNFREGSISKYHYLPVLFLFSTAIIPFLEILFTVQDILKKSAQFMPFFIMGLLMISLRRGVSYRIRIAVAISILLMECFLLTVTVFQFYDFNCYLNKIIGYTIPSPKINSCYDQVYKFLEKNQKKYHFHDVSLVINPNTMEPVDPFLFNILTLANTDKFNANYTYIPVYSADVENEFAKKVDAIYLSDRIDRMKVDIHASKKYQEKFEKESNPNLKFRYKLLYYYSSHLLEKNGWKLIGCQRLRHSFLSDPVTLASYDHDGAGCLFLKNTAF